MCCRVQNICQYRHHLVRKVNMKMAILKLFLPLFLVLISTVHAQSTTSTEICTTHFGLNSVDNIPSATSTSTASFTVTKKSVSTISTTVTMKTPTSTSTFTAYNTKTVTIGANTLTVTSTNTCKKSHLLQPLRWPELLPLAVTTTDPPVTTTSTVEADVTTTVTSFTSTIPTPDGFIPISAGSDQANKFKARDVEDLDARANSAVVAKVLPDGSTTTSPSMYPTAVNCRMQVRVTSTSTIVSTAAKTFTVKVTPPTTSTTKTVLSVVSSLPPGRLPSTVF